VNALWSFIMIWGIWILVPLIVDGGYALVHLVYALIYGRNPKKQKFAEEDLPVVSVIIPTYNEEKNIDHCLNSLKIQDYPHEKIEIIVIDDGSSDTTKARVVNHISELNGNGSVNGKKYENGKSNGNVNGPENGNGNNKIKVNGKTYDANGFLGKIRLSTSGHKGKSFALNTGIIEATGEIIVNIDSDVQLAPSAIRNMVYAFVMDKSLGAATGNIEINLDPFGEHYQNGLSVLDEHGKSKVKNLNFSQSFLGKCQFLEYLNAFRLGREFQARTNSLYTLAGAFSAFRASCLFKTSLYREKTVSEDTDLTFDLHNQDIKIGYINNAKAYIAPCLSWDTLYAQRVRWSRGELEVGGLNKRILKEEKFDFFRKINLPLTLTFDHTFSFLRLIWVLLLPLFFLFGYPPRVIFTAMFLMYLFYLVVDFVNTAACYYISDKDTRKQVEKTLYWCIILPAFRFVTFYFRMAGYLIALTEPAKWQVPGMMSELKNGVNGVKNGVNGVKNGVNGIKNGLKNGVKNGVVNGLKNGLANFFGLFS